MKYSQQGEQAATGGLPERQRTFPKRYPARPKSIDHGIQGFKDSACGRAALSQHLELDGVVAIDRAVGDLCLSQGRLTWPGNGMARSPPR